MPTEQSNWSIYWQMGNGKVTLLKENEMDILNLFLTKAKMRMMSSELYIFFYG